jgi:hypothetical protein
MLPQVLGERVQERGLADPLPTRGNQEDRSASAGLGIVLGHSKDPENLGMGGFGLTSRVFC